MQIGFFDYSVESNLVLLLGAGALAIAGATFISRGLRVRRDIIAGRTALVAPWTPKAEPAAAPRAAAAAGIMPHTYDRLEREIARLLGKIGIAPANALNAFVAIRFGVAIGLALLALIFGGHLPFVAAHLLLRVLLGAIGAVAGWYLPLLIVQWIMSRRVTDVVAGLPDALELLVICAEAGLALEEGIDRVVSELKGPQPALADELALTAADLKILPSRDDALAKLAERIDQPNVRSVVTTLSQTMRFGTPLAQALRTVAAEMRNDSLLRLEERANRLPALLTIPMMLFIMPTIFLIIGGPAALRLMDVYFR